MTSIASCQTQVHQDDDRALGRLAPAAVTDTSQLYERTFTVLCNVFICNLF